MKEINEIVENCFVEITGLSRDDLNDIKDLDLFENAVLDSLSFVSFVDMLSEKLNIKLNFTEVNMDELRTINSIEEYVRGLVQND